MDKAVSARSIILAAVTVALMVSIVPVGEADADTVVQDTIYCYGDHIVLMPLYPASESIWSAECDGEILDIIDENDDGTVTVHLTDVDGEVTVKQTVGEDTAVSVLIPLHLLSSGDEDGRYTITFYDGSNVLDIQSIDTSKTVVKGNHHVFVPAEPSKEGYTFAGWYLDKGCTKELDPTKPVEGDTDVFASWTSESGNDDSIVTVPDHVVTTHVVTFDTDVGLEYDVTSSNSTSVTFTVSVVGGYELKDGTLKVDSNGGTITESNGTYTLSNIDRNIIVTISGEVSSILDPGGIDEPEEPKEPADDGGFSLWIHVVIVVIIVAIVAIVWYMRGRI